MSRERKTYERRRAQNIAVAVYIVDSRKVDLNHSECGTKTYGGIGLRALPVKNRWIWYPWQRSRLNAFFMTIRMTISPRIGEICWSLSHPSSGAIVAGTTFRRKTFRRIKWNLRGARDSWRLTGRGKPEFVLMNNSFGPRFFF